MKLQTKKGLAVFSGNVIVSKEGFEIHKDNDQFVAVSVKTGSPLGVIAGTKVFGEDGKHVQLETLVPSIDPAALVGKDPTTLSKDELVVLTQYLQDLAAGKLNVADKKEAKQKAEKAAEKKTGKKVEKEEKEEAAEATELPEGVESLEDLEKMGAKELWKIAKPLNLDGINSRTKKDDLIEALAEHFELSAEEDEEDEDLVSDELPEEMEDEEEYDEDESDEDEEDEESDEDEEEDDEEEDEDDSEEDEEDSDEEDEDSDDEDDEDEDEEEEEDDEDEDEDGDDELTPEDIDAMESKEEIMAVIKKHGIKLPKKKLNVRKVKQFIKDALFGDDE